MKENEVITDIEQLNPEWLTSIFKNKGYLSQGKVTKIIKKKSLEHYASNMHFLELNFSTDAQTEPISTEIVVKLRKIPNSQIVKHEVDFYNLVAETMNKMPIPVCYNTVYSEKTGYSHLILEDLSKTHLVLSELEYPPSKQYLERAIDCLAEIHAFWWDHLQLKEFFKHSYFLYNFKENSINEKEGFNWFGNWFENISRSLNRMLKSLGDRISDHRKKLFKTIFSMFPQVVYERIQQENLTIIHGDAHYWNFFFPKEISNQKSKAILFDWDMWSIGVGAQDLAYMIGLFFYPDYRHLFEKDLIKRYYNNL
ncbi:MAG: phosphotransferase, partial [Promethearchaeota archaeon]